MTAELHVIEGGRAAENPGDCGWFKRHVWGTWWIERDVVIESANGRSIGRVVEQRRVCARCNFTQAKFKTMRYIA